MGQIKHQQLYTIWIHFRSLHHRSKLVCQAFHSLRSIQGWWYMLGFEQRWWNTANYQPWGILINTWCICVGCVLAKSVVFKISLLKRLQSLLQENARINNDLMDAFNQCEGFFDSLPALVDEDSRKDDEEVRQLLLEDGWVTRGMIDQTRQAVDSCLELVNRLMFPNQEDTCKMGEPVGTPVGWIWDACQRWVWDACQRRVWDACQRPWRAQRI